MIEYGIAFIGGFIAGLFGSSVGSGGLVSFPTLILLGLPTTMAIATNRFAVVFLETLSAVRYVKDTSLNLKLGLLLGSIAAAGSFVGSNIVLSVDSEVLDVVTAVALLIVFLVLFFKSKLGLKSTKVTQNIFFLSVGMFLLGVYGGFFGAGFGTFVLMLFVCSGRTYLNGAGLSRIVGAVMSGAAALTFAYHGAIHYPLGIALGIGYGIGGWIGAGISIKKGNPYIRTLLMLVIAASIVKLLYW